MSRIIKIAAITGGRNVPSRRFRVEQLIPKLHENGVAIDEFVPKFSSYPPQNKWLRPLWAGAAIVERLPFAMLSYQADVVLFQREMISTYATLEGLCKKPRVLDVDDAIFMYREGNAAKKIAQNCDLIVCGNQFLANRFFDWNPNVVVVPTAVDCSRFFPHENEELRPLVIGWIGSSCGLKYLLDIEDALASVLNRFSDVKLMVVSDEAPVFSKIDASQVSFVRWSREVEVEAIQSMDIGIMPLRDSDWERGKCSFKMLQYMACGKAVIVSAVGMNLDVLQLGNLGLSAKSTADWENGLEDLIINHDKRKAMGKTGRQVVKSNFDITQVAFKLSKAIKGVF